MLRINSSEDLGAYVAENNDTIRRIVLSELVLSDDGSIEDEIPPTGQHRRFRCESSVFVAETRLPILEPTRYDM